jgi:hypothetical protein
MRAQAIKNGFSEAEEHVADEAKSNKAGAKDVRACLWRIKLMRAAVLDGV